MLLILIGVSLLSIATIIASGYRFIELSFQNEKASIDEILHIKIREHLKVLKLNAKGLADAVLTEKEFKKAMDNTKSGDLTGVLNDQFQQYFTTANILKLEKLYVLNKDYSVFSYSTTQQNDLPNASMICPELLDTPLLANKKAEKLRIKSTICNYNGKAYFVYLTPIGVFNLQGFLLVVLDPTHSLKKLESELSAPIRINYSNRDIAFKSGNWPVDESKSNQLIITHEFKYDSSPDDDQSHVIDGNLPTILSVSIAKDVSTFETRLKQTVYIGIFISALTIAFGIVIAIMVLQMGMNPIKNIKKAVKVLEKGSYIPLRKSRFPDINETVEAYNVMGDKVSTLINDLQNAMQQAEIANKVKSEFLANMSHEIRTPLTSILGYSERILEEDLTTDEQRESITTIIKSGQHLRSIINDILDLSKIEANELTVEKIEVKPFETLNDVISIFKQQATSKGIAFNVNIIDDIPEVIFSDPIRLKQILINLSSNALKFTRTGEISIDVIHDNKQGQLAFRCKDTGIGISEDKLDKIFRAFTQANTSTTREYGGTGLGLTLSRQLARMLGGDITVQSTPGEGSTFIVRVATGDVTRINKVSKKDFVQTTVDFHAPLPTNIMVKGDILLAEDTPALQDLTSMYITSMGATPHIVTNGNEAVETALRNHYDLILMDIQMPIMDGKEAVKILRATGYDKPILAMTAHAMRGDLEEYCTIGFDDYITKPVDKKRFVTMVSKYLKSTDSVQEKENLTSTAEEFEDEGFKEILVKFIEQLPRFSNDMKTALATNDRETLTRVAHSLKGTGGGYGFPQLSEIALQIETAAKEHRDNDIELLLAHLDEMIEKIENGKL